MGRDSKYWRAGLRAVDHPVLGGVYGTAGTEGSREMHRERKALRALSPARFHRRDEARKRIEPLRG